MSSPGTGRALAAAQVDHSTPLVVLAPAVLAIGCSPAVLLSASVSLERTGIHLKTTTLPDLRADGVRLRPLILLVGADVYDFDPEAFEMVAEEVGASLGVVGSPKEAALVLDRLLYGLRSSGRR